MANAGPIGRARVLLVFFLVPCSVIFAQNDATGWRGQLLSKAEAAWNTEGSVEATTRAVQDAIRAIDGLSTSSTGIPGQVKDLADSLAMELLALDARTKLNNGQPANAVVVYKEAIKRAGKVPALAYRERALIDELVQAQVVLGDRAAALHTYDDLVRAAETRKDTVALRAALIQQGVRCSEFGELNNAIRIQERVLAIDQRSGDDQDVIGTELSLSRLYERIGSEEAFAHARTAYQLAERSGMDRSLLDACEVLIRSFQTTSDSNQCKDMLDRAMRKVLERNVSSEIARFRDRYGRFLLSSGKIEDAQKQFEAGLKALDYSLPTDPKNDVSTQPTRFLAELLLDMGQCQDRKGDPTLALRYLSECERLLKESPELPVSPWADLGEIHLRQGQVAQAADYGRRALADAETDQDGELEQKAADLLLRVYKRQGNSAAALEMSERLLKALSSGSADYKLGLQRTQMQSAYQDSIMKDRIDAEVKRNAAKAEHEAAAQRTRYLVIGGIILFLAAGVVVYIDRKRRIDRFDREAAQLETQALRSQMNPHFIFNALNSINAFVQKNEPDKAASFLSRFARLMRLVLENSRQSEVPLKDDLEALDAYLHLERARSGEKFDYRIEVAADIDPEDVMVPPLVAQPFVENAIWHGMSGKEEKGMITLSVSRKNDQLLFAIEDDGVGRSSPKRMASMGAPDPIGGDVKKTSLGTAITKARLDLVRQQKGKDAGFVYVDLPQGTRVELTLPFSTAA